MMDFLQCEGPIIVWATGSEGMDVVIFYTARDVLDYLSGRQARSLNLVELSTPEQALELLNAEHMWLCDADGPRHWMLETVRTRTVLEVHVIVGSRVYSGV